MSVRVTYEESCTERFVEEAIRAGDADTVVCAGGDGSVKCACCKPWVVLHGCKLLSWPDGVRI